MTNLHEVGLYCHVNKTTTETHDLRRHDQSNHIVTIAAALNWSGKAMIGGGGVPHGIDCLLNAGPTASTCGPILC